MHGSTLARLRAATWPAHQRLEKRLAVRDRFCEAAAYRAHLEQMWGFCAGLEKNLGSCGLGGALGDYASRHKLPLLERDLIALGLEPEALAWLPVCGALPDCSDVAAALGCLYVIEGSTLGGQTLAPLVQRHLGLDAERGAAFLAGYGENTLAMWRAFGSALDAWCGEAPRQATAVAAGIATFEALESWLCGPST